MTSILKRALAHVPLLRHMTSDESSPGGGGDPRADLVEVLRLIEKQLGVIASTIDDINTANIIRIMDFELKRDPRYSDPRRLLGSAAQVCSQNGEDGMIGEIFRRIGTRDCIFAEVGVEDGHENNTAFLLAQGWSGFWFDGDDRFASTLQSRTDLGGGRIKGLVAFLTRENIGDAFSKVGVPEEFDLLSLDVDQNTYYLWEGLSRFRPRVVVVEYNASIPPDIDWKVRYDPTGIWDRTNNFGASLKAYELMGSRLGYCLVGCDFTGVNAFFVRSDLAGDLFASPFTAANHYEPPRYQLTHRRGHKRRILDLAEATNSG